MAAPERCVQVVFDPLQYAALEAEAEARRWSVAAVIRAAVDERLGVRRSSQEALARYLANGDAHPTPAPIDWEDEKDSFERDSLRNLP